MTWIAFHPERRALLRRAGGLGISVAAASVLTGCGGGGGGSVAGPAIAASTLVTPPTPAPAPVVAASPDMAALNFALNLQYLSAQFYAFAASGGGLPPDMLAGAGVKGAATGGRAVVFADPLVGQYVADSAADKAAHVSALRATLGSLAVAHPAIDLTGGTLAAAAGLAPAGGAFDPFAGDDAFLLGAFLFEETIAAAYRGFLPQVVDPGAAQTAADGLAMTVYHAGAVRGGLVARFALSDTLATAAAGVCTGLRQLYGGAPAGADQSAALADPAGPNILDGDPGSIPYSRSKTQVMAALYGTTAASVGGYFPAGFN